ncbi:MMPL family transporter [bacterium]|nr:MMPL family transporter [bacterium]
MNRFAEFILTHPRRIVAACVAFVVGAAILAGGVSFDFNMENLIPDRHPARAVYDEFTENFEEDDATYIIAIGEDNVFRPSTLRDVAALTERLDALAEFETVTSVTNVPFARAAGDAIRIDPFIAAVPDDPAAIESLWNEAMGSTILPDNILASDRQATAIFAKLKPEFNHHEHRVALGPKLVALLAEYARDGRAFHIAGVPQLRTSYIDIAIRNLIAFVPLSILMLIVVLYIVFRTPAGVILPLATVVAAVIGTLGVMRLLDVPINLLTNVLPTVILVVGISDAIHLLIRYREELRAEPDKRQAITNTLRHIAGACFYTSITTAVGFASLVTSSNMMVRQFGLVAAIGVMLAYIVTIVLLPAALILMKTPPPAQIRSLDDGRLAALLRSVGDIAIGRPGRVIAAWIVILGVAAWGSTRIEREYHFMEDLPETAEIQIAYRFADAHLGSAVPLEVEVRSRSGRPATDPALLGEVDRIADFLRGEENVGKVVSAADFHKEMNRLVNDGRPDALRLPETQQAAAQYALIYSMADPDPLSRFVTFDGTRARVSARTKDMGQQAFQRLVARTEAFVESDIDKDLDVRITGAGPMIVVLVDRLVADMVTNLGLAFVVVFFLVVVEFRSIKLAALSMLPNFAPLLANAGIMGIFGFHLNPTSSVTFAIGFGIAVDDTIHFIERFRRELPKDRDHDAALRRALRGTGRAMVFTTLVLMLGFIVIVTSEFRANRDFGKLAACLLGIALLADLFLLPALIRVIKPNPKAPKEAEFGGPEPSNAS